MNRITFVVRNLKIEALYFNGEIFITDDITVGLCTYSVNTSEK